MNTTGLNLSASSKSFAYPCCTFSKKACRTSLGFLSSPAAIIGTNVSATMRLAVNVNVIVNAMSTNSCLVIPSVNTIGTNTHTVVKVDAIMAPVTPPAPSTAALLMEYPSLRRR